MGSATGILWGMLLAGMGVAAYGLWRSVSHFQQWRRVSQEPEGEVVPAAKIIQTGQVASIEIIEKTAPSDMQAPLPACIADVGKSTLILECDPQPARIASSLQRKSAPEQEAPLLFLGAAIAITITEEQALYRFTTSVREARSSSERPGFQRLTVTRPLWMARVQRRRHVRAALKLPATFEPSDAITVGRESGERSREPKQSPRLPLHGTVIDLSGGGLRAEVGSAMGIHETETLMNAYGVGTVLQVRLPIPTLRETPLLVRVCSCSKTAARGGLGVRLACEFLPLASWEQELIIHYVFHVQREWLGRRRRMKDEG